MFYRNILNTTDGRGMWQLPDQKTGFYDIKLQLPDGIKCEQCILQVKQLTLCILEYLS